MKLLMSGPSPFVRKVRVVLHETGQVEAVEQVSVTAAPGGTQSELAAVNPTGKIPVLIDDNGRALYDSRVICRYLDARVKAGLYPPDDWDCLVREALADGMMEAAVLMVYETRHRTEAQRSHIWVDAQWGKITAALDALEAAGTAPLCGPLEIGQIAIGCALSYLDLRHGGRDWRAARPTLAAWHADFGERPSMQATRPED